MIKTLSPYYLSVPLVNPDTDVVCESYTAKIYIWSGNKSAVPAEPEYEKTKINAAASNGTDKINISRIVNDFIDFNCEVSTVTSLENGNNQAWVKVEFYYSDQPDYPKLQNILLAVKGYGYFLDGENPQIPTNKILLSGDEFKVNRGGLFVLPILLNEITPEEAILTIDSIEGLYNEDTITYTDNFSPDSVTLLYRQTGDTIWTFGGNYVTNPIVYDIPLSGSIDVQLVAFHPELNEDVYSNIFVYDCTPVGSSFEIDLIDTVTSVEFIFFTVTFDIDHVVLLYKQTGSDIWIIGGTYNSSPITFDTPLTGSVDYQLITYNLDLNENSYSNIYTIII